MKKNLLVTLANKNYVKQAKALFSSAYFNAGWKGDYMLLSHEIPEKELKWFRKKGILVKKCKPLAKGYYCKMHPCLLDKFYLLTPEFKKWKTVIYLDGDIIVRGSLDELTKVPGFSGVRDIFKLPISVNFHKNPAEKLLSLKKECNLKKAGFNSGVIAFDTCIINKKLRKNIFAKIKKYLEIANGDQPLLNIIFNKETSFLPSVFNVYIPNYSKVYLNIAKRREAIVLHFCSGDKPWLKNSPFYKEWKSNLDKSNLFDLSKALTAKKIFNKKDARNFEGYLKSIKRKINNNRWLGELYKRKDYNNYKKLLFKCILEDGLFFWRREIFYYFASFFPKKTKDKIKKLLN